nr:hypothetical protein CPGR_04838 [Mycolicibacterium malmesburyense]
MHLDLLDRQERQRRGPFLRFERLLHGLDVVRRDHDQQRYFLGRVDGGLAGLLDEQRLDLVAMLAEPNGVAGQHPRATRGAAGLPLPLRLAQAGRDARHVGGVGPAHGTRDRSGRGIADGAGVGQLNVGRRSHDPMLTVVCDSDRTRVDTCQVIAGSTSGRAPSGLRRSDRRAAGCRGTPRSVRRRSRPPAPGVRAGRSARPGAARAHR